MFSFMESVIANITYCIIKEYMGQGETLSLVKERDQAFPGKTFLRTIFYMYCKQYDNKALD